jgi:hypothetical protein
MSRNARELRSERAQKKLDAKRVRRVQRDERRTHLNMTVVSAVIDPDEPASLAKVKQQTHAALLYADNVTLVSPAAALMQSVFDVSRLDDLDLLLELGRVAPRFFPYANSSIQEINDLVSGLPPRPLWTGSQRLEYDNLIKGLAPGMRPIRDTMQANAERIFQDSEFDQLQLAVDAGILTVETLPGVDVSEIENTQHIAESGLLGRISELLTTGRQYPLFDSETHSYVRESVEQGVFSPAPMARRLGKDAAMADGLFDRLPSFQYATTSEILDIRSELSGLLRAFRKGVSSLTTDIDVPPEDADFGREIEYAWNNTVADALDEIEATIRENSGMKDLMKRVVKDSVAGGAIGVAATGACSLAVAAGPVGQIMTATGMVYGLAWGAARALIAESDAKNEAIKGAQFYFLYGTEKKLGFT